jgi:hypothetical protein
VRETSFFEQALKALAHRVRLNKPTVPVTKH